MTCPNCDGVRTGRPRSVTRRRFQPVATDLVSTGIIINGERQMVCPRCQAKFWFPTITQLKLTV